ncbi:retrovirus-related Pol polyprotein from transposon 17.6 [Trichonephila clavipes]|nr:retrovirus-related Pol polyprotein from transposon 17.6 [Trichonephila clavipes]
MEPPRINLTSDLPIYQRAYRTSATSEAEINKQIQNLLAADAEPLPRIDSLLDKLNSAKYFSMLDLTSGYWHIPLHDKDKEKLAFVTTEEGCITPDNQNIETIKKLRPPKNVKQLQSFLGSVNVYNKFIDSYAKIREPLNQLLKKDKQWDWTAECQTAFELLKNKLITKPVLQLYDPKLPLHVFCDTSLKAIGAILKQPDNSGTLHPVSFHSGTLREYEKNYCITELECLAIVDALDKFYYYLHGKKFIIHTDHAALVWFKNVKNLRGRLFRWSVKLSMFDYEVKYLKGTNNVEADMLSRHPIAQYIQHSVHLLELNEIKTHQNLDNVNDPKYKKVDVFVLKKKNLFKIVVPFSLRTQILKNAHEQFGHPVTKFPPAYLLFGTLPYTPPLAQNQVYPPVEEARKLAKENTIKYHEKNKIKYDAHFIDYPFEPGDLVIYEEFNYPNQRKLSPIFSGPYEIVQKLLDVNYEITKPNTLTKKPTEIVHVSKLRTYYPPEELKLRHE